MLWETVRLAMQAIARNTLRSMLTVLGVVIGVGAVIAMVTIGNGTTAQVTDEIQDLGTNLLFLRPGQGFGPAQSEAPDFSMADIEAIERQIGGLQAVAPAASANGIAVHGNENRNTTITGTTNDFFIARDWDLLAGRRFHEAELRAGKAACLLGQTVREELFGSAEAVGDTIRIKGISCEVIGLLEEKGESSFGRDQDDVVLMPIRTVQRRILGNADVPSVYLSAASGADTDKVRRDVVHLMRERRHISAAEDDDFQVRDMAELVETMTTTTRMLTGLIGAVAAVSLLVGGIGIMNIMLVSVTERTREIGIRLAVGAQERQVLLQFLVEAVVLSAFGGLIGIGLGLGLAAVASGLLGVPFIVDPSIVALAVIFSGLVGIAFGFFPARRAARLDPIEALRHE